MAERTYSEREIAAILERAVERQEEARRAAPETGLSLEELERVGQEVGIAPAHLRAAAAELDATGRTGGHSAGQTKTHVVVERWLPGAVHVEAWEDAVAELQERFGGGTWGGHRAGGSVSQVDRTYEWTHTSTFGVHTRVTLRVREDRTRLRLTQHVGIARPAVEGPLWGGLLTLLLGLLPALEGFPGQPGLVAAITAAVFVALSALMFVIDTRWRAGKLRQLDALADELSRRLAAPEPEGVGERAAEAAPPARTPALPLDLDALADDTIPPGTEADPVRPRRRTRS